MFHPFPAWRITIKVKLGNIQISDNYLKASFKLTAALSVKLTSMTKKYMKDYHQKQWGKADHNVI